MTFFNKMSVIVFNSYLMTTVVVKSVNNLVCEIKCLQFTIDIARIQIFNCKNILNAVNYLVIKNIQFCLRSFFFISTKIHF